MIIWGRHSLRIGWPVRPKTLIFEGRFLVEKSLMSADLEDWKRGLIANFVVSQASLTMYLTRLILSVLQLKMGFWC
jgi:hypothetical protein